MDIEKAVEWLEEIKDAFQYKDIECAININEYKSCEEAIKTVLSELNKKESDLYEANNRIVDLLEIIDKKDKIINEMAIDLEYINSEILDEYDKIPYAESKQKIIDYFTKKVKEK